MTDALSLPRQEASMRLPLQMPWAQMTWMLAALVILLPSSAIAQHLPNPIPGPVQCEALMNEYEQAIRAHRFTSAQEIGIVLVKDGCYRPPKPIPVGKACSNGIKNIATFLQTCPSNDPAFSTIFQDFSVSYDSTPFTQAQLTKDLNTVCTSITNSSAPQPTITQQAEYVVSQVFRTMYYMDSQGTRGCPYPWTGGTSLYNWEKAMVAGVDIRDDSAYSDCCEQVGTRKYLFGLVQPAASQYPVDYTWMGIGNQMALYAHEARHSPNNLPPPNTLDTFLHTTCCPEQGNSVTAACDNTYNTSDLSPYGIQYWLFSGWLNGTVNVGYACMPPADAQAVSQLFDGAANGYIGRFCTNPPATVPMPAAPGGPCPP
jgi:hypothetical protein